jgi:hypothetical protein
LKDRTKKAVQISGGALALMVMGGVLTACDSASSSTSTDQTADKDSSDDVNQGFGSKDATADVKLGAIGETSYGSPSVKLTVTNNSEKRSNYSIEVVLERGNEQLDEGSAYIQNLDPGQVKNEEIVFFSADDVSSAKVRIVTVDRTAAV